MNEQLEAARTLRDEADRKILSAVYYRPNRDALTRDELLAAVEVALCAGYVAGYGAAQSDATQDRILALRAKIDAR